MNVHLIADVIGYIGVALNLSAYFLLQNRRLDARHWLYPTMNVFGAGMILVSLAVTPNRPAIIVEGAWLAISLYGIFQAFKKH